MNIRDYFDLSKPIWASGPAPDPAGAEPAAPPRAEAAAAAAAPAVFTRVFGAPVAAPLEAEEVSPRVAATAAAALHAVEPASPREAAVARASSRPEPLGLRWQLLVYGILVVSILSSRFLDLYRAGLGSQFTLDWQYLLFLGIASLAAFPLVYDKAQLSTDKPILVQVAVIFATGMGWEKIIATAIGK